MIFKDCYYVKIIIIAFILFPSITADQSLQCGGEWDAFNDEKCFRVFDNRLLQNYEDSKTMCQLNNASSLVAIRSKAEQDFLFNLLVNVHKDTNGVWIGTQVRVNDNTSVTYTNWANDNPKNITGYDCVYMSLIEPYNGQWLNAPCNQNYLVVCEKAQNWLFSYLQQTVIELRQSLEETKKFLENEITQSTPAGTIAYFANTTAPRGWLKASGQTVARSAYPRLFEAIGTRFGSGDDGITTFTLPDLRGEFLRGWSDGKTSSEKERVFGSIQNGSIIPIIGDTTGGVSAVSSIYQNRVGFFGGNTFDDGFDNDVPVGQTRNGLTYAKDPFDPNNLIDYVSSAPNAPIKGRITSWHALRGTRPRNVALLACIKY